MNHPFLEAALRYAARGLLVFPCESHGKRPTTKHGLLDATTDTVQIQHWWGANGNANVAIRTGLESRLIVLDVDGDEGAESLRRLEHECQPLPVTASVVTPSGGSHYYFRRPRLEIRNSAGQLGPGLDVRGDGGYVIAPPSTGSNGRRYEPDERAPMAEMPTWLLERLKAVHATPQRAPASEWVAIVRDGLPEGERNHGLTRITGHLLSRDVDARLVHELVLLVNRQCRPPLGETEVSRIVESIAGRELRKRTGTRR